MKCLNDISPFKQEKKLEALYVIYRIITCSLLMVIIWAFVTLMGAG